MIAKTLSSARKRRHRSSLGLLTRGYDPEPRLSTQNSYYYTLAVARSQCSFPFPDFGSASESLYETNDQACYNDIS